MTSAPASASASAIVLPSPPTEPVTSAPAPRQTFMVVFGE